MRKLPEILTKQEQVTLLGAFNTRYFTSHRNKLIMKMGLQTGMRISELISLRFTDITQIGDNRRVHIHQAKGNKDRILWISAELHAEILSLYWEHNRTPEGYVFQTFKGDVVQDAYLRRMIKEKGKAINLPRIHFHLLRHTYLTELYSRTKDIRVVQEVAGHASITTTMIYTHISGEGIRAAMMA